MTTRFADLERTAILVQYVGVAPLTFYSTADGTDLVQNVLRTQLSRSDTDIFGQEGSASIDDQGEFLNFSPFDTQNRSLHLPIEHLAYCGALRRMRRDPSDQRDPDQIHWREFENVDLANRYPQYIIGPHIFVAVFHGFDNALCYTFLTQSSDDACLLVMKLMRAFKTHEQLLQQQQQQQGQMNQGFSSSPIGSPSPVVQSSGNMLSTSSPQPFFSDNRPVSSPSMYLQASNNPTNMYAQDPTQDVFIQRLLTSPNMQMVNRTPSNSFMGQHIDDIPILSAPPPLTQQSPPVVTRASGVQPSGSSGIHLVGSSTPHYMRPASPPVIGIPDVTGTGNLTAGLTNPQVIYKPNDQEVVYKQNIMVRWLQPPTPPPPAPIIIREVQAPSIPQPPIICRQVPPCPRTPPPIVVRERPPVCPPPGPPLIIEKRLPPVCQPRQVIVERYPAPPPKPPTIIYEKYLPPQQQQQRSIVVQRETCAPPVCTVPQPQPTCRRIVREVVRNVSVPTQPTPTVVQQQPSQVFQQLVPVFATRQHIVQPRGVRVIRHVIGPSQPSATGPVAIQPQTQFIQQPQQFYSTAGQSIIQAMPGTYLQ